MRSHLLVPTDFSMPAKKMVRNLHHFRRAGAERITLLYVREARYPLQSTPGDESYYDELLGEMAGELRDQGWEVKTRNEEGRPGSRIVEVGDEVDADLIVLANHGHRAISEVVLGSVATDVLERAKRPVFLYCDEAGDELLWDRIVHPTDFSKPAEAALEWITDMAVAESTPVVLLHAVDARFFGRHVEEKRRNTLQKLGKSLQERGVVEVEHQVVEGPPKKVVIEAADHYPGALFVMGSRGRGWFGDMMLGGVARAMARRGTHHVLFVQ